MMHADLASSLTDIRILPSISKLSDCLENGGMLLRISFVHLRGDCSNTYQGVYVLIFLVFHVS